MGRRDAAKTLCNVYSALTALTPNRRGERLLVEPVTVWLVARQIIVACYMKKGRTHSEHLIY